MIQKVMVGIVGTGNIVGIADSHLKAYSSNPNVSLTAVYDISLENAKRWVKDRLLEGVKVCKTFDEFLSHVDAVSICTPNFTHVDLVLKALKAGKHVLCEKPLSTNYEEGLKVAEYARSTNLVHMMGFCYRGIPAIKYIKKLIDEGKIGNVFLYRATMGGHRLADPNIGLEWRMQKKLAGAGSLTDFGSHLVDLADYLLNDNEGDITEVEGFTNIFITHRKLSSGLENGCVTNDDCAIFQARTSKGALMSFMVSRVGSIGHTIEIIGSGGIVRFDQKKPHELKVLFKEINEAYTEKEQVIKVSGSIEDENWFNDEIDIFISGILNEKQIQPDLDRGVYIQRIIDAVEESTKTGKAIKII